uniref:G-protein coupled receptors family 3 profile domain-containing protein n=1 Tax=Anolis carolinensis TaxID=28377 RepID=H9GTM0_ANOCA
MALFCPIPLCFSFYSPGYQQQLAMRFAIDEINNSTALLPGITLGYEIHDTCNDELVTTKLAISFLSEDPSSSLAMQCNYANYKPRVVAVVGPNVSGLSMLVISAGSSSIKLSDKQLYPSFFRTIPSDQNQADAMVQLLNYFNWNWVAALVTDNEYGHQVLEVFVQLALSKDMCVAYEAIFPRGQDEIQRKQELVKIANQLEVSRINATVIFSHSGEAEELLQVVAGRGITGKVWIASECWSTSSAIALIPNLNKIGTVLGMAVESGEMPGFQEYIQKVLANTELDQKSPNVLEACPECSYLSLANFSKFFEVFNTYKAIYAIAHALHQLLNCSTTHKTCDADRDIYPWQLLEELPKVNFTIESQPVHFSKTGDPPAGYDLLFWDWILPNNHTFAVVGRYDASTHKLNINESKIRWSTENGKAPVSRCTQGCKPAQKRWLRGEHNCCYQCEDCPAGYFQDTNKPDECTPCSKNEWSTARSTTCQPRAVEYLEITDLIAIIMMALTVLVFAQMVAVTGIFATYRGTPAMRYVRGFPLQSILFSTTCFCVSFPFFVMKPTKEICKVRQPLFFGSFTLILATLLGKTLQSVGLDQILRRPWVRNHLMVLCIVVNAALQGLLCLFWYYWEPPVLEENTDIERTILLQCHDSKFPGFGILLAHDYCLAVICFACSLVGYNTEKKKDNVAAKSINFAMLLILIIWIIFVPTYSTTKGKFVALFQVFAGLASIFAIFGSYYYPVCYVMLFAPHLNTDNHFCLSQDLPVDKEPI